jgi:hypothetical protein
MLDDHEEWWSIEWPSGGLIMLSVIIATHDDERGLLPTLAALVPGATAGWVREVIVAYSGASQATAQIADIAGCELIASQESRGAKLKRAAEAARAPWLLFLQPGVIPDMSWVDETRRFAEQAEIRGRANSQAAVFRLSARGTLLAEAIGLLRLALGARSEGGLLIAKPHYRAVGGHRDHADDPERDLMRHIGRRRITVLRCGFARGDT